MSTAADDNDNDDGMCESEEDQDMSGWDEDEESEDIDDPIAIQTTTVTAADEKTKTSTRASTNTTGMIIVKTAFWEPWAPRGSWQVHGPYSQSGFKLPPLLFKSYYNDNSSGALGPRRLVAVHGPPAHPAPGWFPAINILL